MRASDRAATLQRIVSWLHGVNPELARVDIAAHTDIIETRALESLQIVEFILFLETESGRSILSEDLNPDDLRTLDAIYRRFFEETA